MSLLRYEWCVHPLGESRTGTIKVVVSTLSVLFGSVIVRKASRVSGACTTHWRYGTRIRLRIWAKVIRTFGQAGVRGRVHSRGLGQGCDMTGAMSSILA